VSDEYIQYSNKLINNEYEYEYEYNFYLRDMNKYLLFECMFEWIYLWI